MQIDVFWILSAVILYLFLFFVIFFFTMRVNLLSQELTRTMHEKSEINTFFNLFAKKLNNQEAIDDAMGITADYVAELIGASSLCIYMVDENGLLNSVAVTGKYPPIHNLYERVLTKPRYLQNAFQNEHIRPGHGLIGKIASTGEGVFIKDALEDEQLANSPLLIETLMAVPMKKEGQVIGVICAVNNRQNNTTFTLEKFSGLKFMADQVVLAHTIVDAYRNISKQQRIDQELQFAQQLQSSMLPDTAPKWGPFEIQAFSKPAKEVSGDFYDFVPIDEDRLLVVIADACGKGIPACMLMAMTRSFIRASVERFTTLQDMIKDLNNDLFRDSGAERFVTVSCCLLNKKENTVEFVRAGHTELLINRESHPIRTIFPDGAALGLLPAEIVGNFDILSFAFLPTMSLLLFSDGITEALNMKEKEFGLEKLIAIFKEHEHLSTAEQIEEIIKEVNDFSTGVEQADDQTIVLISYHGNSATQA